MITAKINTQTILNRYIIILIIEMKEAIIGIIIKYLFGIK